MSRPALCHLFQFTTPDAPEVRALGLAENFRRSHPGQGTSNVCCCLDNAYLEFLWVDRPAELAAVPRLGFAARSAWRTSGASPFGIGLHGGGLPFPSWDHRLMDLTIPVAVDSDDPRQPLLFLSPGKERPDQWPDGRAGRRQTDQGLAEIMTLHLDSPVEPAPALRLLADLGLLTLGRAERHRLTLTVSRSDGGRPTRLVLGEGA